MDVFDLLSPLDRVTLGAPTAYWDDALSREQADALVHDIIDAFYDWQSRQADSAGMVSVVRGGMGLLSFPTSELVGFDEVEPWQCAGPFVHNDIDLAFKLWLDGDPGLLRVIEQHGLGLVFALVGSWSTRTAERSSLIRLNGFLVHLLVAEAEHLRRVGNDAVDTLTANNRKRNETLALGRKLAAQERKAEGERERAQVRRMAMEFYVNNPNAGLDEAVSHLKRNNVSKADGTIKKIIAGVWTEARNAPRAKSGLYATGQ